MGSSQVLVRLAALLLVALSAHCAALGQDLPAAAAAAPQVQFPQLPLKRDSDPGAPVAQSLGWAALLLASAAAVGFVALRRKGGAGKSAGSFWLRGAAKPGSPKLLSRTLLTQQASVHVIEWEGEELLLGCTPQAVSLLARRPSGPLPDGRLSNTVKGRA